MNLPGCNLTHRTASTLVLPALLGATALLPACGIGGGGGGSLRLHSRGDGGARLAAALPTRVYRPVSRNEADIFMTDLPAEVFTAGADVSDATGMIVHVKMFVAAHAGRTPIDRAASTAAVRVLVLSRGEIGVYGGGGFFVKSGDVGDSRFGGSIDDGTVHLVRSTPAFDDRIGPSLFGGSFSARRDPEVAAGIERALTYLSSFAAAPQ